MSESSLRLVLDRFEYSKVAKQSQDKRVERYTKLYNSYLDEDNFPYKTKIFIPYSYMLVESIIPRIMFAIYNSRPILLAKAREQQGVDAERKITSLLDWAFDNDQQFNKTEEWSRDTIVTGTGICKYRWNYIVENDINYSVDQLLNEETGVNSESFVRKDEPESEIIDYYDYYPDPDYKLNTYAIHRIITTYDMLKRVNKNIEIYKNLDKIKETGGVPTDYLKDSSLFREKIKSDGSSQSVGYDKHKDYVEILEYWEPDRVITVANRSVVIRETENQYGKIPFIKTHAVPAKSVWGESLLQPVEKIQHYVNSLKAQKLDLLSQMLQPMWLTQKNSGLEGKKLNWIPNRVIPVNSLDAIRDLRPSGIGLQDTTMEERDMLGILQRVTGATDYLMGINSKQRGETATSVSTLSEASTAKIRLFIQRFTTTALRELGYSFLEMFKMFTDQDIIFRKLGESKEALFETIQPNILMGRYQLDIVESAYYDAAARQEQFVFLYNALYGKPEVDPYELTQMMLEIFNTKREDKILRTPEEYQKEQVRLIQLAMQEQQEAQGGAAQ